MASIEQDFKFAPLSAAYGQFLVEVHSMDSHALLVNVTHHYGLTVVGSVVISVTTTEDIAMLLKLRFGTELVKRPEPKPEPELKMKILKNRNYGSSSNNKKYYYDYESSFDSSYMKLIKDDLLNRLITTDSLKEELKYLDEWKDLDKYE